MATYNYIESNGVVVPDTSEIQEQVENEYKAIFGDNFVVDPESTNGLIINAEVTSRSSVINNNAEMANQINPNIAGKIFLDAIWSLTGGERLQATKSTVTCTVAGVESTPIPAGSIARTQDGDEFELISSTVIPAGGSIDVVFQSVEFGPISASSGALTIIVSSVVGWETITNSLDAVLGRNIETGAASRRRRRDTLAAQSSNTVSAVLSNLREISGVRSALVRENTSSSSATIDTILMLANSIVAVVQGGSNEDIAKAIADGKGGGCALNGDVVVPYTDPVSSQISNIIFFRPTDLVIYIRVTISASTAISSNPTEDVRGAILNYAAGNQEGEEGIVIGQDVSPFEIAGAVNRSVPGLFVSLVELSTDNITFNSNTVVIDASYLASILSANITVISS